MKKLKIFGRNNKYKFDFEIESDIKILEELKKKIREPLILNYSGLEPIDFFINGDHNFIGINCINWIFLQNKSKQEEIHECLLKCATEDKEWTEWRNKKLTGTFYRKITFCTEIQDAVCEKADEYIQKLNKMRAEIITEKQKKKEEIEKQKSEWEICKVFKDVRPTCGENGRDGYIDAEYISKNGDIVRMVERDVFDVGCYCYPKRFEGSDYIFRKEEWTEAEISLTSWMVKFGKFHGIRM